MAARGIVAVVGSRQLPSSFASHVQSVVAHFVERGWGIGSGGARGADTFALQAVVAAGPEACRRSLVCLPGRTTSALVRSFARQGGRFVPGSGSGRAALLGRSRRLVQASAGVVAFLWGPSRGSVFTVRQAVRAGKPAAVVLAGGSAALPAFAGGRWEPCRFGSVATFRWVREPRAAEGESASAEPKPTALGRIFVVPEGEPVEALMAHISSLSAGERLWFETGVLAVDTVMVQHEALSDTPAFLALPRLRRRFRCSAREAAGLAELFLALEAGPDVVAWAEREARRHGVAAVIEDLAHLVAQLALAEGCQETDPLTDAERLGEWAEDGVTSDGHVTRVGQPGFDGEHAALAWHALGSVQPAVVECPSCRAAYVADDERLEIPTCPTCATPDTWEARRGPAFRQLVAEIDGCASLAELGVVGKRLYGMALAHDEAGVAWTHYGLRKAALEAAVTLGAPARALVREIEQAPAGTLGALGARLYRLQHGGAVAIAAVEWRRVWQAYHARRRRRAA
jgi:hypothetical protein